MQANKNRKKKKLGQTPSVPRARFLIAGDGRNDKKQKDLLSPWEKLHTVCPKPHTGNISKI